MLPVPDHFPPIGHEGGVDLPGIEAGQKNAPVSFDALDRDIRIRAVSTHHGRAEVARGNGAVMAKYHSAGTALASRAHPRTG
jgi:hypothetical protein